MSSRQTLTGDAGEDSADRTRMNLYVDQDTVDRLDRLKASTGFSRSALVRIAARRLELDPPDDDEIARLFGAGDDDDGDDEKAQGYSAPGMTRYD